MLEERLPEAPDNADESWVRLPAEIIYKIDGHNEPITNSAILYVIVGGLAIETDGTRLIQTAAERANERLEIAGRSIPKDPTPAVTKE